MAGDNNIVKSGSAFKSLLDRSAKGEKLSEKELTNLSFEDRLWLIQRAPLNRKSQLIISSPDPIKLLKKLSPEEIYLTVKESWGDDAAIILEMTSAEKIIQLLDMDIWKKDRVDFNRFLDWLQLVSEGGERALMKSFMTLDPPLLVLFFKGIIEVESRDLDQDHLEFSDGGWNSFDYTYYFRPIRDELDFEGVSEVLSHIFEIEPEYYKILMEGIKGEMPSPTEEEAYQLRSSRMSKIGFPEFYEAREILLYENPDKIIREMRETLKKIIYRDEDQYDELPPQYWMIPMCRDGLLETLLNEIADSDRNNLIFWELSYLIHKLMAANGYDPSDIDELMSSTVMARDYINLGLEALTGGDLASGRKIIHDAYLQRIFRLGYSIALDLKKRGETLINRLDEELSVKLWDQKAQGIAVGLRKNRPYFYGDISGEGETYRNFNSLKDIHSTDSFLAETGHKISFIAESLTIPFEVMPLLTRNAILWKWDFKHLFATALARNVLEGVWEVIPLSDIELDELYGILRAKGKIPNEDIEGIEAFVKQCAVKYEDQWEKTILTFIREVCEGIEREFLSIDKKGTVDPRYIETLITEEKLKRLA